MMSSADMYDEEFDIEEMLRRQSKGSALSGGVSKAMAALSNGNPKSARIATLAAIWEEVAPKEVLERTGQVFMDGKTKVRTMIVFVDGSMMAAELNARAVTYLIKINVLIEKKYPRFGKIDAIKFRVSRDVKRRREFKKRDEEPPAFYKRAPLVALDDGEESRIAGISSQLPNKELQKAFYTAMKAHIIWNKSIEAAKQP